MDVGYSLKVHKKYYGKPFTSKLQLFVPLKDYLFFTKGLYSKLIGKEVVRNTKLSLYNDDLSKLLQSTRLSQLFLLSVI